MMIEAFRFRFGARRARSSRRTPALLQRVEQLEVRRLPSIFTVLNTLDDGPGSLRQAMLDANSTPNVGEPDEIHFDIPGDGVHRIFPGGTLPPILERVIIDGYTQPGASVNTLAVGDNAVLKIEIDGSNLSAIAPDLFHFGGDGSTVRGLSITHVGSRCFVIGVSTAGVAVSSNNNTIAGNFIGTDADGSTYLADNGVAIQVGTFPGLLFGGNRIGGTAPADRNVITGAGSQMIDLGVAFGTLVQGNYIGVTKDGTARLQPPFAASTAIGLGSGSHDNTIGGTVPGAGNVILGTNIGVGLFESSTGNNLVQGNFIGTNATGTAPLFGGTGIFVNTVSGIGDTILGNLISGNTTGIESFNGSPGPVIQGNLIGTDVTGTLAVPNLGNGINITGVRGPGIATIGGTGAGEGNTIAFNGGNGLFMSNGAGRAILGNSIFANGKRGIRLFVDGNDTQTVNDPGDADTGPNGLQNYPVITTAATGVANTSISGTLNSTPNTSFRIEFFASEMADPSGFGEGQTFLGFADVTTDAGGDASFSVDLANAGGPIITATATAPDGSTSEFSHVMTATGLDIIIDANTTQEFLDSLTVLHGSLIMVGVAGRTDLFLPNLTQVDGDFIVTDNPDLTTLSAPLLTTVGGDFDVSDNPALTSMNLGDLTTVGGSLTVNDNTAVTGIDLGSVASVGNNLIVDGNTAADGVDLGSVTSVDGSVSISGNQAAIEIDVTSLTTVDGSVSITGNQAAIEVDVTSLTTVGGDETIESRKSVTTVTAAGNTEVSLFSDEAQMTAVLAAGTFAEAVGFTVIRLDSAELTPEAGLDFSSGSALIDPLVAYQFNFAIPTLNQNATLTFEINVAALSTNDRDNFLAALAAGNATVAVKNDAPGSVYQAFAISPLGQPPTATSVSVVRLDANGDPLPDGSTDIPTNVRFVGITGHFSTFAVVIVTSDNLPPVANDDTALLTAGTSTAINVLANDSDAELLTVTAVTQPPSGHGNVTINPNGTVAYLQTVFVNGTESFSYAVSDGHGGTDSATVTVTVNLSARVGIGMLADQVRGAHLSQKLEHKLLAKLEGAEHSLDKGSTKGAVHKLAAFGKQVSKLKAAGSLPASVADLWLFELQNLASAR